MEISSNVLPTLFNLGDMSFLLLLKSLSVYIITSLSGTPLGLLFSGSFTLFGDTHLLSLQ
jgi:hypothetical protein